MSLQQQFEAQIWLASISSVRHANPSLAAADVLLQAAAEFDGGFADFRTLWDPTLNPSEMSPRQAAQQIVGFLASQEIAFRLAGFDHAHAHFERYPGRVTDNAGQYVPPVVHDTWNGTEEQYTALVEVISGLSPAAARHLQPGRFKPIKLYGAKHGRVGAHNQDGFLRSLFQGSLFRAGAELVQQGVTSDERIVRDVATRSAVEDAAAHHGPRPLGPVQRVTGHPLTRGYTPMSAARDRIIRVPARRRSAG